MSTLKNADEAADPVRFVLSTYMDEAMRLATYDKLDDGSYGGRIAPCTGVVAFGSSLRTCEDELRSTLDDWVLVGLKLKHRLPVLAGIVPNGAPVREQVDAL